MKIEEALHALQAGKTVRLVVRGTSMRPVRLVGEALLFGDGSGEGAWHNTLYAGVGRLLNAEWEEVVEEHDFAWAREQLVQGKAVTSLASEATFTSPRQCFSLREIDGKWVSA